MGNKRAQFFGLFLVVITLFLCVSVILLYNIQQKNVESSMVSPKTVLDVRDNLERFNILERELIIDSLKKVNDDFCSKDFLINFRENFIKGISKNEFASSFIFDNLALDGVEVDESKKDFSFIKDVVYPEVGECSGGKFIFSRAKIGKSFRLAGKDKSKINFPVEFSFEFNRKYLITFKDGEYSVEVLE